MPAQDTITIPPKTRVTLPGGTIIETGGLAGTASQSESTARGLRAAGGEEDEIHPRVRAALAELEIEEQETIFLDVDLPPAARRLRAPGAEDRIVVEPLAARADTVQVVLYQDESGGMSWHLPDDLQPGAQLATTARLRNLRAGGGRARFTIAARTTEAQTPRVAGSGRRLRGLITSIGRKVLKVLVIPILSPLLARPLESIVGAIERRHHQELIRGLTADNYRRKVTDPFTDWAALDGRRSLLVVHGIFSTTEGVLSQFPEEAMRELSQHYGGRMIAFDQLTVSRSAEENARFFLDQVHQAAPEGRFEFDVLCHSRGGIVSRTLAERGATLVPGNNCQIRNIFFVATPNRGSVLADPEHIVDMVDTFTNVITSFPDGPVTYSIEVVLAILKLIVHAAETHLPGLAAMGTGTYIAGLNRATAPSTAAYAAAAANYTPDPRADNGFITGRFANRVLDRIFKDGETGVPNDLIVPFEGVFAKNGHPSFPIANPLVFGESDRVWHSGFFSRPETFAAIKQHFGLPGAEALRVTSTEPEPPPAPSSETPTRPAGPRRPRLRGAERHPAGDGFGMPAGDRDRNRSGGGPPAPSKPVEIKRDPQIDFHEQVIEGMANVLTVRLEDITAQTDVTRLLTVALAEGRSEAEITVTLAAPGFDVEAVSEPRMIVKTNRDPALEKVEFRLTARNPGPAPLRREISANFWLGNSCIGAVGHRTMVIPKGYAGNRSSDGSSFSSGFLLPPARRNDCDLAVGVQGDDEAGLPPFRITLRSEISGHEYSDFYAGKLVLDQPGASLGAYLNQFYSRHFNSYPSDRLSDAEFDVAYPKWRQQFAAGLLALGKKLWTFLPQRFRDEYFRLQRAGAEPKSILIHSDEMILPWELIVPHQIVDGKLVELQPLGQRHVLGRWKPGLRMKPQPQRLAVSKFLVVNPRYTGGDALPSSEQETQALRALFSKITVLSPANCATFASEVLTQPDVHVLHFSGHGDYDQNNSDLNTLLLEDGDTLDALAFNATRFAAEGCPIVYLNACQVGRTGTVVGRMGGFCANLLQSGCSGVIAPYWPVDDQLAAEFSLELYRRLAQGDPIGVVLRDLRAAHPDDPTYCAFSYFGDPWAQLDLTELKM